MLRIVAIGEETAATEVEILLVVYRVASYLFSAAPCG